MRWRRNTPPAPTGEMTPTPAPDLDQAVDAYAAQARAADQLAEVDTRHLDTPTANPNAVDTLNRERDTTAREKITLDYERERMTQQAEHARQVDRTRAERRRVTATDARADRAVNEGLADADEAAAELAEVRQFERTSSPATATRRLMRAVRGWRREEFVYALAGSALSAAGISALLIAAGTLPAWVAPLIAVVLEVVLTVRVIRLIGQRAELAEQHKGQALQKGSAGARALTFLTYQIVGLLAVSVLLNLAGLIWFNTSVLGVLGALGAVGAALASWSAWQASVATAETVHSNVSVWQGNNWASARQELRTRAAGAYIPVPESADREEPEPAETERLRRVLATLAEEHVAALADRGTDALAVMLSSPPEGGTSAGSTGGTGGGTPLEPGVEPTTGQGSRVEPVDGRQAVLEAVTELGLSANNSEIGRLVGLSRTTVRKRRTELWRDGHQVFPPDHSTD